MISVCIPAYNFDITSLVKQLCDQKNQIDFPVEIIVIDDCSDDNWREVNKDVEPLVSNYILLEQNVGRSAIRNLFLKYATQPNLLFLDCDGLPHHHDFLTKYYQALTDDPSVIVGGRTYGEKPMDKTKMLRWSYGMFRESKNKLERQKNPYKSFMTNNFMIHSSLLQKIGFDETLVKYGHEDTLFGFELEKKLIPILHIDNPVLNVDLEPAREYLLKTKEGVKNLFNISSKLNHQKDFVDGIKLLKYWKRTRLFSWVFTGIYAFFHNKIQSNLLSDSPNLKYFDFFKLNEIILESRRKVD